MEDVSPGSRMEMDMVTHILYTMRRAARSLLRRLTLFGIAAEVFYKPMDYDTD